MIKDNANFSALLQIHGRLAAALMLACLGACSSDSGRGSTTVQGTGIPGLGTDGDIEDTGSSDDGFAPDDDTKLDLGGGAGDGVPPDDNECAAVSEQAESTKQPADIIFVVDNSGSMGFEAEQIQQQLNGFSQQIIDSGVDVHVVLISSYPDDGNGICIAPPLGGGGCANDDDNNPPTYTHVDQKVGSHNAWDRLLFTHPQWAGAMRPEASKHVVIVTDDTSNTISTDFDAEFAALDPSYAGYIHHSVVCHSDCQSAAGIGTNYINLSTQTGGVASDLCDQDFQAVFDVLSTEVINGSQLSCEWELPPPPDGMDFDPDAVNVEFADGQGDPLSIGRVESAAQCANVVDGWYYDDPDAPQFIVFCDQTCDKVQDVQNGSISIAFGCATIPAG